MVDQGPQSAGAGREAARRRGRLPVVLEPCGPTDAARGGSPRERWHRSSRGLPALSRRELLTSKTVFVAGLGLVGSYLPPLLAAAGIGKLILCDRDTIEEHNYRNQNYDLSRHGVGQPKAELAGAALASRFPELVVETRVCDVENVPLGVFDVDAVVGCLDSRRARQALISDAAWPLGVPVLDAGVDDGTTGRVQVFHPGPRSGCIECGWGRRDFELLAVEYSCSPSGRSRHVPRTAAPALCGAAVAAVLAAETLRVLVPPEPRAGASERDRASESYEVAFDLENFRYARAVLRRAPGCRFDHAVVSERVSVDAAGEQVAVGHLVDAIRRAARVQDLAGVGLTFRRPLRLGSTLGAARHVAAIQLLPLVSAPIGVLGLHADDLLRVTARGREVFVAVPSGTAARRRYP